MKKKDKNLLLMIPVRNDKFQWEVTEDNLVVVLIEHKGFYPWIAQKVFKTPKISRISLDEYGSYVWQMIDGNRNVEEIAEELKRKFDKNAEPLYNRLVKYFSILQANKFVSFKEEGK